MAPEDHLVNYFHCAEYHPGVLEDGIGVTWVSYFLPEKDWYFHKGLWQVREAESGWGDVGGGGGLPGQGKQGDRVPSLKLLEVGQEGVLGTRKLNY